MILGTVELDRPAPVRKLAGRARSAVPSAAARSVGVDEGTGTGVGGSVASPCTLSGRLNGWRSGGAGPRAANQSARPKVALLGLRTRSIASIHHDLPNRQVRGPRRDAARSRRRAALDGEGVRGRGFARQSRQTRSDRRLRAIEGSWGEARRSHPSRALHDRQRHPWSARSAPSAVPS